MTRDSARIWGTALWFNLLWFLAVIYGSAGILWPAVLALGVLVAWSAGTGGNLRQDARMAVAGVLIAYTAEPVWLSQGLIHYEGQGELNLPPDWITLLWVAFAICFNHCLQWLQTRRVLAVVLGLVGSVLSILSGERLGALSFPQGWFELAMVYGPIWAVITPALAWLAWRLNRLNLPAAASTQPAG